MENYVANSFDKNYAAAWSMDQGGFSSGLAQNLLAYLSKNKINAKTCLDVCCGTGEFLNYFTKAGLTCSGTEIAKSMVDFCKEKYPTLNFALTKAIYDIPVRGKFDIITCNHDMVNTIERFVDWQNFFKEVASHLNRDGVFMFDYYTKAKLENWNEVVFEESDTMDHVSAIRKGMDNKCIMNEIYYIKNDDGTYNKTFDVQVEAYFENDEIVAALNKAGFKHVTLCNFSLEPATDLPKRNRIHVIARR